MRISINLLHVASPKHLCQHLLDEKHSYTHRVVVGVAVMAFGVSITALPTEGVIHYLMDGVGYMFHGIGSVPLVQKLETLAKD